MTEEKKYIHYCWFGGKPLPRLARECLKSWKRFFPDYEIICWNEENCNFDECEFVRRAYDLKYYAFVADYFRAKVLCEMGGIYFDTDMKVVKDPKKLLESNVTFLGVEDTGKVACGVWYEKKPGGYLAKKLLAKYQGMKNVDFKDRANFSIPLLITKILEPCGFDYKKRRVQELDHDITIYSREYFYPYSYNRTNNLFTDNTYMIHYYDASWLPIKNRIENYLVRHYGRKRALKMIKFYQKTYVTIRKIGRLVLFPIAIKRARKRKNKNITTDYLKQIENTVEQIRAKRDASYLIFHNGEWFGVTSATKELFNNTIDCRELYRRQDVERIAKAIDQTQAKQLIFSGMSKGGPQLAGLVHKNKPEIKIKVFWHGSMSQVLDPYGWKIHTQIMKMCKQGYVSAFATCKESLYRFYKKSGINVFFITNKVGECVGEKNKKNKGEKRIGLYAASPKNWRKNMFSQIAAVSLIKDAVLDIVPLNEEAEKFAKLIGIKVTGVPDNLKRKDLIKRMSLNDVNLYVTFSECSPMLPLESLEVGVPCITGNNHHYFANNGLKDYLVVDQEDDPEQIKEKITVCINNRKSILELYEVFKKDNLKMERKCVKEFLEA